MRLNVLLITILLNVAVHLVLWETLKLVVPEFMRNANRTMSVHLKQRVSMVNVLILVQKLNLVESMQSVLFWIQSQSEL